MTRGFFASLLDFSFSSLITTKLIKLLYGLSLALIVLVGLGLLAIGFHGGVADGIVMLVLAPLGCLVCLIYVRVLLELVIAGFRIMENTQRLAAIADARVTDVPEPDYSP